jgi:putative flippase GtrA
MKAAFRDALRRPSVRYLVIGGSVYTFELLVIVLAQHWGARPVLAVGISFCLGTAVSFLLTKLVTFSDHRMHRKVLLPQIIATICLVLCNLGFSLLLTALIAGRLPTVVVRTLALGITTIWNFYLYRTRIFNTDIAIVS